MDRPGARWLAVKNYIPTISKEIVIREYVICQKMTKKKKTMTIQRYLLLYAILETIEGLYLLAK